MIMKRRFAQGWCYIIRNSQRTLKKIKGTIFKVEQKLQLVNYFHR